MTDGIGPFAEMLSTAKSCSLLDKHMRIVGWDKDVSCLQKSMQSIEEVYVPQFLSETSDLTDDDKLKDAVHVYGAAMRSERLEE